MLSGREPAGRAMVAICASAAAATNVIPRTRTVWRVRFFVMVPLYSQGAPVGITTALHELSHSSAFRLVFTVRRHVHHFDSRIPKQRSARQFFAGSSQSSIQ